MKKIILIIFNFLLSLFISFFSIKIIKEYYITKYNLIVISPLEALTTSMYLGCIIFIIIYFPFIVSLTYNYIKEGLYIKEKKIISEIYFYYLIICILSIILSYFATKIGLKILSEYFINNMWTYSSVIKFLIGSYLFSVLVLLFPIIIIKLLNYEIIIIQQLEKIRIPFIIIGLILAAIITPPDILSQLIIFIPIYLFYEGIIIKYKIQKFWRKKNDRIK